jgi:hypothetical protein
MKLGPFILLKGALSIEPSSLDDWEAGASQLVALQKYIPWYLGDMVVFGEATQAYPCWSALLGWLASILRRNAIKT